MLHARRTFMMRILGSVAFPFAFTRHATAQRKGNDPFTILFQGDSITDGNRGRSDDPNHILGHGYAFSLASELGAKYPDRGLRFLNKGVSGDKISDLALRWKNDTLDLTPDVLSILVGVNDIHTHIARKEEFNAALFESHYRELLDRVRKKLPNTLLVIGEPFILSVGMVKNETSKWMEMTTSSQQIVKKLSAEYNAVFLPYQNLFSSACQNAPAEYWIWDGIHPTYSGHGLMKTLWIEEVSRRCEKIRP
jgi:lysophospholipase L1-like esterase